MHVHYLREYSIFVIRRKIKYFQRFSVIKSLDNVSNRYQTLSWCSSVIDQRNSWILQFSWILEFLLLPKISDSAIPRIFFSAILQNHSSNEICDQNRIHQCFYCRRAEKSRKLSFCFLFVFYSIFYSLSFMKNLINEINEKFDERNEICDQNSKLLRFWSDLGLKTLNGQKCMEFQPLKGYDGWFVAFSRDFIKVS